MDYQNQQELSKKADNWKVEELQRTIDNVRRENNELSDRISRTENDISMLHSALRSTLQAFTEAQDVVHIDVFQTILNQM